MSDGSDTSYEGVPTESEGMGTPVMPWMPPHSGAWSLMYVATVLRVVKPLESMADACSGSG
eukprot:2758349-Prymnesium_polylepis.1